MEEYTNGGREEDAFGNDLSRNNFVGMPAKRILVGNISCRIENDACTIPVSGNYFESKSLLKCALLRKTGTHSRTMTRKVESRR